MPAPPAAAPLLAPREIAACVAGLAIVTVGLVFGHPTPSYSHAALVEKATLEDAKQVTNLLPDAFRIEVYVKKMGLTLLQSEDIILLGGDAADAGCSGGALFLWWEEGAVGFGCQCNGPTKGGCPSGPGCSDPAIKGGEYAARTTT